MRGGKVVDTSKTRSNLPWIEKDEVSLKELAKQKREAESSLRDSRVKRSIEYKGAQEDAKLEAKKLISKPEPKPKGDAARSFENFVESGKPNPPSTSGKPGIPTSITTKSKPKPMKLGTGGKIALGATIGTGLLAGGAYLLSRDKEK